MDGRSWPKESEVRRDDQFTRAPEFRDEHDSDHLPMWDRLAASWHGMSGRRRAVLTATLVALSMMGGASLFTTLDDFGGKVGTQPEAHGPLGAEDGSGPGLDDPGPLAGGGLVNGTADPTPSLSLGPAPPS